MTAFNNRYLKMIIALSLPVIISACATKPEHPIAASIEQDMVLVEGGQFIMGSDAKHASKAEQPAREVQVDSFYIAKFEVTQGLFESVMGSSMSYFQGDNMPVNNLSWQQANYFIERLNALTGETYRLPTEAEWEFAAMGGNYSQGYIYSGSNNIEDVAWYKDNSNNQARAVGLKAPNELGLYDMTGNVGEFVIDAFDDNYYRYGPNSNPNNAQESDINLSHKSVRGGSFSYSADQSENFRRDFASQSIIMSDMGLRLAKDH
ncbi:formylglycine-generating enzyme family protein [Agarivorans sp. TSD2052]|uniref:formylglycine-generating enzyme family protein n=1 Tax=Agarivorans sp. TSD2052 TaxID=2937286 RepID=UPI0020108D15|nr:SUMF1/EgtB/PvdO family nonheme iron enzyme [Agarivorans sp. TSD2052]UPW16718.1 formylglycine-generating enzyme family protein [Agarivorans sp. TSD2052]